MRKIFAIVLSLAVLLSVLPCQALAAELLDEKVKQSMNEIKTNIVSGESQPQSNGIATDAKSEKGTVKIRGAADSNFAGGTGTESDPYLIATKAQLEYMRDQVNSGNQTYAGLYLRLTNDINLNGAEWLPIGYVRESNDAPDYSRCFWGNFNGNGHKIYDFKITKYSIKDSYNNQAYIGLFGWTCNSTISDLGIEDFSIDITWDGYIVAGGLAGAVCTVYNCYTTGYITAISEFSQVEAGGLKGGAHGHGEIMSNCYATGDVIAISETSYTYAGGLVGKSDSIDSYTSDCYATGDVRAVTSSLADGEAYAGGLVGEIWDEGSTMSNCYATGDVLSTSNNYGDVCAGGFAGQVADCEDDNRSLFNCYATGYVEAVVRESEVIDNWVSPSAEAGGLVGRLLSSISNCYATGDVEATSTISVFESVASSYAGGLVGYIQDGTVFNCNTANNVTASALGTDVTTHATAGGLIGNNSGSDILNCYVYDTDFNEVIADANYDAIVGGLIGDSMYGTISNSYVMIGDEVIAYSEDYAIAGGLIGYSMNDTISNSHAAIGEGVSARGSSDTYAGGLVGCINKDAIISGCYAICDVDAEATAFGDTYAGGLVGCINGDAIISGCYAICDVYAEATASGDAYAGGLIGDHRDYHSYISNCSSTGYVTASSLCGAYAGGLVGHFDCGSISNCYAMGETLAIIGLYTETSKSYAGGLVGQFYDSSMSNCYAMGDAYAMGSARFTYTGGLVGNITWSKISNCYAIGDVNATTAALQDKVSILAGGLVGTSNCTEISNCYAVGDVTAITDESPNTIYVYAGGLIGSFYEDDESIISNCYRCEDQVISINDEIGASNLLGIATSIENLQSYNFITGTLGWSTNDWYITDGEFPRLIWEVIHLGDLNGDGTINAGDAVLVLRFAAELTNLNDEQQRAGDVNADGVVNVGDAVLILRYAAGLIDKF